jgi:hypothetical protein
VAVSLAALHYYDYFNITDYTAPFFDALFNTYWAAAIPVLALIALYYLTFQFSKKFILDAGLSQKTRCC